MPKRTQKRARKSEAKDSESDEAPSSTNKRPKKNEVITIKQHFSGTVNTIRRAAFGAPGSGIKPSISYFKSTTISSQSELEVFCSKIKRHGHILSSAAQASPLLMHANLDPLILIAGRHFLPSGRIAVGNHASKVFFQTPGHKSGAAQRGHEQSATQRSSGVEYGSLAAALVELAIMNSGILSSWRYGQAP